MNKEILEKFMTTTKKKTSENIELVKLDGNCPD